MSYHQGWIRPSSQADSPGWDPHAAELAEEELEMALAWLYNRELLDDHNGKVLTLEWALYSFWVLSKCQFGYTVDEAAWHAFLHFLLPWEDNFMDVQTDIRWVWDPKYHYCLDFTSTVPIWAKPPHLRPEEEAWLDVHLDKLVAKGVIGINFARGAATMCYTIAPSARCLVWAALSGMPKHCPG